MNKTLPIELDLWTSYDPQGKGKITQFDATFRYWDSAVNASIWFWDDYSGANGNATKLQEFVAETSIKGLCETSQRYCNGTNQQYSSMDECLYFLGYKTRFGEPSEAGKNTVLCRLVHEPMVHFRPDVHCPHIGPTGGGMCVDSPGYIETVLKPVFNDTPFVPWGYRHTANLASKDGLI